MPGFFQNHSFDDMQEQKGNVFGEPTFVRVNKIE